MTSPLVYDIIVPLTFLGSATLLRHVMVELNEGPERHSRRLTFLHQSLRASMLGVKKEIEEKIKKGNEKNVKKDVIRDVKTKVCEDENPTEEEEVSDAWLLRRIPSNGAAESDTDTLPTLSAWEKDAARKRNIWTLGFTLSRMGIPDDGFQNACDELEFILTAFRWEHSDSGALIRVVVGEAQSPSIVLRPKMPSYASLSATARRESLQQPRPSLQEPFVQSVVLAFVAFERELCTLASPLFLLKFCPLSHILFMGEVRKLRHEKRVLLKRMAREWEDKKKDRTKQEQEMSRLIEEWAQGVTAWEQERNKVIGRREAMAGVRERDWWRLVERWFQDGSWEGYELVKALVEMTGKGRSTVLGLHVANEVGDGDDDEEMDTSTIRANDEGQEPNINTNPSRGPKSARNRKRNEDTSLPSPLPSLPEISHLTVHLPPSHLHKTILANLRLTYHILDLARIPNEISKFLAKIAIDLASSAKNPRKALPDLGAKLGMGLILLNDIFKDMEAFDDAAEEGEEERENKGGKDGQEREKQTKEAKPAGKDAIGRVVDAIRRGCEQGRRAVLRSKTGEGYFERYRKAKGWEVVSTERVVKMMHLEEIEEIRKGRW